MELGIKGHSTRSNEVIKILEMLGGINYWILTGGDDNSFYYIGDKYKDINRSYIGPDEIKGYEIFSLEDFLEKFPYKVGDKVNIWVNHEYLGGPRAELEVAEIKSMRWNSVRCEVAYRMKELTGEFYKSDIKGKVNDEENLFHTTDMYEEIVEKSFQGGYEKCKLEMNMNDNNVDLTLKISTCYVLPDGFHFADENGNVIEAKKILLVKNSPSYPKNYDECCDVLNIPNDERYIDIDIPVGYNKLLSAFTELLICRDAYWKIAGEELGLDKPWDPVWDESEDLYTIHTFNGEIRLSGTSHRNAILVFPIEEMRDAFHNNFKDLIEQCKELL